MAKRNDNLVTIDRPTIIIRPDGTTTATADAIRVLEAVGVARGAYFHEDMDRDFRVIEEKSYGKTLLVAQEDVSHHGSPCWKTVRTLSDDPAVIAAHAAFLAALKALRAL